MVEKEIIRIGLDVGSTTVKAVVMDSSGNILHNAYLRHFSKITEKVAEILGGIKEKFGDRAYIAFSGSAGMGLAEHLGLMFIQEVYATKVALDGHNADVAIELGGEDAKILFLSGGLEVRMNGTCAGGTGSFIDQMATLLGITVGEINSLSQKAAKIYPIASRCGVFAKTDIQPLLNQGADRSDLAKSILYAIVNQTIGGLAQGRAIKGNVLYLGGPLTFLSELKNCFDEVLGLQGTLPDHSLFFVATGAALMAEKIHSLSALISGSLEFGRKKSFKTLKPLFSSNEEYAEFTRRHSENDVEFYDITEYRQKAYLGVDSGSTTVKMVIIGENGQILHSRYLRNNGNPVALVRDYIKEIYEAYPRLNLVSGASTGYGEDLIKNAFCLPVSVVETVAHFTAAKKIMPGAEFVIDIGGQDMKCFKIRGGAVDDIFLNEACSSGCGSFLQTFAEALGYSNADFAKAALLAQHPVDLGSRCTVFMNSSVKQAQKDGATVADISAGLASSVVKNALYKVIRVRDRHALGAKIVVQGGTFLSDAVLRAFEQEMDAEVIRPNIAGLMGAYGAALYALNSGAEGIIGRREVSDFSYSIKNAACGLCANNCGLNINYFEGGRRKFISGNRCERPLTGRKSAGDYNIFDYKLKRLAKYMDGTGVTNENNRNETGANQNTASEIGSSSEIDWNKIDAGQNSASEIGANAGNSDSKNNGKIITEKSNTYSTDAYAENRLDKNNNSGDVSFSKSSKNGNIRGEIGLPMALNLFELLPFWHSFFDSLGIRVRVSPFSDSATFKLGQNSIPSDTVCYPAKLVHGHIQGLINAGVKNIFYPCMSYNINENISDNHYNCPVVAYYPQVVGISMPDIQKVNFIQCFLDLNNLKVFNKKILDSLLPCFPFLTQKEVAKATKNAFKEFNGYRQDLRRMGQEIIDGARKKGMSIIVLCGRPYHADPEVHHGIPSLIAGMNVAVISEDSLPLLNIKTSVLNQWTYHARMYSAAKFALTHPDINIVQLVSFGCGLDAVTTDEVKRQLEAGGKLYTQLKIDEITNLGAVKIRLKSLFAALEQV